jgi:hypothetical protein
MPLRMRRAPDDTEDYNSGSKAASGALENRSHLARDHSMPRDCSSDSPCRDTAAVFHWSRNHSPQTRSIR